MRQHRISARVMGTIGGFALVVAGAAAADERGAAASAGDDVTIVAEFVQYDFAGKTPTVGPFELAALLHPASLGPAGVACTVDRIAIEDNHVELTFPESGGEVVGVARLRISCEYHPTCGPVTVAVDVDLRGAYDAGTGVMTGGATVRTADTEATSYGSINNGPMTCGDRWTRAGYEFATSWLFDTAHGTGYLSADPVAGDPVHRYGYFSTSGAAIVTSGAGTDAAPLGGAADPAVGDQDAARADSDSDPSVDSDMTDADADADADAADTDADTADAAGDAGAAPGDTTDGAGNGGVSRIGLMIAFLLILAALLVGFRSQLLTLVRSGRGAPLPSSDPAGGPPPAAPKPTGTTIHEDDGKELTTRTIVEAVSPPAPPPQPPPPQEFQIVGAAENGYRYIDARTDDGAVVRLHTGTKIRVVSQLEHMSLVKPASGGRAVWVDRRDIQMVNPDAAKAE